MKLKLNISPCPNDTFMFEALVNRRVDTEGLRFDVSFADIEQLNATVLSEDVDISKISYAVFPALAGRYRILGSGSALGHGNGPLLVSAREVDPGDGGLRVAVPGEHTTANLLLERLYSRLTHRTPVLFSEIAQRVASGEFDAGVLIHEGRFTYGYAGLRLVSDLGKEWERVSGMPLPLGAIVVSEKLGGDLQRRVDRVLRRSVEYAMLSPDVSMPFVRAHAREMDDRVMKDHIALFVNGYSVDLGDEGRRAVARITGIEDRGIFVDI